MNISGPAAVAKPEMLFYAPGDLTVTLVALERVDVNNIVLHAPEQYHVACGKVSPVADLKQRKQKADSVVERRRKATLPAV